MEKRLKREIVTLSVVVLLILTVFISIRIIETKIIESDKSILYNLGNVFSFKWLVEDPVVSTAVNCYGNKVYDMQGKLIKSCEAYACDSNGECKSECSSNDECYSYDCKDSCLDAEGKITDGSGPTMLTEWCQLSECDTATFKCVDKIFNGFPERHGAQICCDNDNKDGIIDINSGCRIDGYQCETIDGFPLCQSCGDGRTNGVEECDEGRFCVGDETDFPDKKGCKSSQDCAEFSDKLCDKMNTLTCNTDCTEPCPICQTEDIVNPDSCVAMESESFDPVKCDFDHPDNPKHNPLPLPHWCMSGLCQIIPLIPATLTIGAIGSDNKCGSDKDCSSGYFCSGGKCLKRNCQNLYGKDFESCSDSGCSYNDPKPDNTYIVEKGEGANFPVKIGNPNKFAIQVELKLNNNQVKTSGNSFSIPPKEKVEVNFIPDTSSCGLIKLSFDIVTTWPGTRQTTTTKGGDMTFKIVDSSKGLKCCYKGRCCRGSLDILLGVSVEVCCKPDEECKLHERKKPLWPTGNIPVCTIKNCPTNRPKKCNAQDISACCLEEDICIFFEKDGLQTASCGKKQCKDDETECPGGGNNPFGGDGVLCCKSDEVCIAAAIYPKQYPIPLCVANCNSNNEGYSCCFGTGSYDWSSVWCKDGVETCSQRSNGVPFCVSVAPPQDNPVKTSGTSIYMVRRRDSPDLNGIAYVITPRIDFSNYISVYLNYSYYIDDSNSEEDLAVYRFPDHEKILDSCNNQVIGNSITWVIGANASTINFSDKIIISIPQDSLSYETNFIIQEYNLSTCYSLQKNPALDALSSIELFSNYNEEDYAVDSKSSSGESGGSSGGGSGGAAVGSAGKKIANIVAHQAITPAQLEKGYTHEISSGDNFEFSVGSESHQITIDEISSTDATITFESTPQIITLRVGEEKKLDLNEDNYYDLSIRLDKINVSINKAEFTIRKIKEFITEKNVTSGIPLEKPSTDNIKEDINMPISLGLIILIVFIIIILVFLFFLFKKKRKKK